MSPVVELPADLERLLGLFSDNGGDVTVVTDMLRATTFVSHGGSTWELDAIWHVMDRSHVGKMSTSLSICGRNKSRVE